MSTISEIAQTIADKSGWRLHPVRLNKHPFLKDWPNLATNDTEKIREFWEEFPDASIGMACGPGSGVWVLDIDLPDGPKNLEALEKEYGKLPETLMQQTGSGGFQYFWKWNGHTVRNSGSRIAKNIDIRGFGGFVILPPSPHPSGNNYRWLNKAKVNLPPQWLVDLAMAKKDKSPLIKTYGQAALNKELAKLGQSTVGERNETLNQAAYSLGQLVAGGELDHSAVFAALLGVSLSLGLGEVETRRTIESGMNAGALEPRSGSHDNDFGYLSEEDVSNVIMCKQEKAEESTGKQNGKTVSESKQSVSAVKAQCKQDVSKTEFSLAEKIADWICNSPGSFTTSDIDREFCLSTRGEKNNRSVILNRLHMARKIKKDKRKKGVWHSVEQTIDFVDLDAKEPTAFPLSLPFGIHEFVKIPPKAIILLAGTSNAGKTAFILNALRLNLSQDYDRLYLMSEMGSGEYMTRIRAFGDGVDPWRKVKAASKSYDFDGAVQTYNPDGLTCVDYLEEVDGEYFRIPTDIRNIYDALGDGVALVAIQKRTDQEFARGGQGTLEKARLAMNLDYLATGDHCIFCALKLVKVKHFIQRNLQNHEIHFKLEMGCNITPVTDWMLSSRVNRKKYIQQYELGNDNPDGNDLFFKMDNGENKRIIARDINKWQESFPNIDVYRELERIAGASVQKPFLTAKGYFFQLSGILRNKNNDAKA
jgi:hypothetical protein